MRNGFNGFNGFIGFDCFNGAALLTCSLHADTHVLIDMSDHALLGADKAINTHLDACAQAPASYVC